MHGYPSSNFMYMDSFMRWFAFGPSYDSVRQFDYDKDPAKLVRFAKDQDAVDPDLSKFKAHGGKLILYNAWADHSTPPLRAVQYYEDVRMTSSECSCRPACITAAEDPAPTSSGPEARSR
jgi:hypothetical protein